MGRLERNIDPQALAVALAKSPQPHRHASNLGAVSSHPPLPEKPPKAVPAAYRVRLKAKRDRRLKRRVPYAEPAPAKTRVCPAIWLGLGAAPDQYDIRRRVIRTKSRKPGKSYKRNGKRECARRCRQFQNLDSPRSSLGGKRVAAGE